MTIYTQTVTLTVFSKQPINENVLIDSLKDDMHKLGAVADVEVVQKSSLTDANGETELWDRGFDPDVLDGYTSDDTDGYIAGFQAYANHQAKIAGY